MCWWSTCFGDNTQPQPQPSLESVELKKAKDMARPKYRVTYTSYGTAYHPVNSEIRWIKAPTK